MFDPELKCPLLKKKCIRQRCQWFVIAQGENPLTGEKGTQEGCVIPMIAMLLHSGTLEQLKAAHGVQQALESGRNVMHKLGTMKNMIGKNGTET